MQALLSSVNHKLFAIYQLWKIISFFLLVQVSALLQIGIVLGVLPHLAPGVGLAIEKRSAYAKCVKRDATKNPPSIEEVIFFFKFSRQ